MTTLVTRQPLTAATSGGDPFRRSCTEGDPHPGHRWSDGRRSWTCAGRAGRERLAEVVELSLAG